MKETVYTIRISHSDLAARNIQTEKEIISTLNPFQVAQAEAKALGAKNVRKNTWAGCTRYTTYYTAQKFVTDSEGQEWEVSVSISVSRFDVDVQEWKQAQADRARFEVECERQEAAQAQGESLGLEFPELYAAIATSTVLLPGEVMAHYEKMAQAYKDSLKPVQQEAAPVAEVPQYSIRQLRELGETLGYEIWTGNFDPENEAQVLDFLRVPSLTKNQMTAFRQGCKTADAETEKAYKASQEREKFKEMYLLDLDDYRDESEAERRFWEQKEGVY